MRIAALYEFEGEQITMSALAKRITAYPPTALKLALQQGHSTTPSLMAYLGRREVEGLRLRVARTRETKRPAMMFRRKEHA